MYIKINKEKVKFINILNGEPVLFKVEKITLKDDIVKTTTSVFVETDYLTNGDAAKRGHIVNINNLFTFNITGIKCYETVIIKLIKEQLKTKLSLTDDDLSILAEVEWKHPSQPIRITIPIEEVIENEYYRNLVGGLIANEVIKYKINDNYVLYLTYIEPVHRTVLEADENIIIEE